MNTTKKRQLVKLLKQYRTNLNEAVKQTFLMKNVKFYQLDDVSIDLNYIENQNYQYGMVQILVRLKNSTISHRELVQRALETFLKRNGIKVVNYSVLMLPLSKKDDGQKLKKAIKQFTREFTEFEKDQ